MASEGGGVQVIPSGFCGLQTVVRREKKADAQVDAIAEAIDGAAKRYEALFHRCPDVCFVRMRMPGIRRKLREMENEWMEIVPVNKQMLMWHVWVGVRGQDE